MSLRRSKNQNRERQSQGQSLIELVLGLMALIPIMLVVFDLAVIVIAVQMNDSTCREAARVAASGNPTDIQQRANAIIDRANARGGAMMSSFQLISCTSTASSGYLATVGKFGGPVNATVTVQTEVGVRPFIVQWAYGGVSPIKFRAQQTFPFTYVMPSATAPAPSGP